MTLLQKASLVCISLGSTIALASDLPRTVIPDNIILCEPAAGCTSKVLLGRTYQVLSTARFVVMVSLSQEGHYTRADVSIANNTGLPFNLSPEDFRVEEVSPKPKVLPYVPPAGLKGLPGSSHSITGGSRRSRCCGGGPVRSRRLPRSTSSPRPPNRRLLCRKPPTWKPPGSTSLLLPSSRTRFSVAASTLSVTGELSL